MMSTWTWETTSSSINQGPDVSVDAKTNTYRFARYSQSDGLIGSTVKYATIEKSVITGRKDTFFGRGDGLIFTVTSGTVSIHRLDPLKQTSRLYGIVQRPLNTELHWQYRRDGLVKSIIKKGVHFMAFYENRDDGKISCCGKLTDRGESIVDFSEVDVSFNGDFGKIERTLCVDDATDQIHITELSAHYQLSRQSIAIVQAIDAHRLYMPKDSIPKSIHDRGREYAKCDKSQVGLSDSKQAYTVGN